MSRKKIRALEQRVADLVRENEARVAAAARDAHVHSRVYYKRVFPRTPFTGGPIVRYGWTCVGEDGCGEAYDTGSMIGMGGITPEIADVLR